MAPHSAYSRLPSERSFRLLRILELKETNSEIVSFNCALDTYPIDKDPPPYVALSYTWGPPFSDAETVEKYSEAQNVTVLISHDGRLAEELCIGRNLFSALVQIHKSEWQSYLWADAICINQADTIDRNAQVQLMSEIFSHTEYVVAWLGREPVHADDIAWWYGPFSSFLQEHASRQVELDCVTNKISETLPQIVAWQGNPENNEIVLSFRNEDKEMVISSSRMIALIDWFLETRFFKRLWVLQELVLPKKVVYLLGTLNLSTPSDHALDKTIWLWQWLCDNYRVIKTITGPSGIRNDCHSSPPCPVLVHAAMIKRSIVSKDEKKTSGIVSDQSEDLERLQLLEYLLSISGNLSVSDPRDHLYCLLGLISRATGSSAKLFEIDYNANIQDHLQLLSSRLLTELPYMSVFGLKPPSAYCHLDLPSWVVDLTTGWSAIVPRGMASLLEQKALACPLREEHDISLEIDGKAMKLYGHYCGEVVNITRSPLADTLIPNYIYHEHETLVYSGNFLLSTLSLACDLGRTYKWTVDQSILDAIVEITTFVKDSENDDSPSILSMVKLFVKNVFLAIQKSDRDDTERWKPYFDNLRRPCQWLIEQGLVPPDYQELFSALASIDNLSAKTEELAMTSQDSDEAAEAYYRNLTYYMGLKALFRTQSDHIGICPDDAEPGDQLWVLCRSRVPHVLRPLPDGTYITLGSAHVHGGMEGQLIERNVAGPVQRITIV